jgi:polysaccharide biosynthesis protein PelG
MLVRILQDLPAREAPVPPGALRGAFREYKLLALSALAVHAAVWIDKLCTWAFDGAAAARTLSTASALAWFAVIPAFAWIYVQVETAFYRVFRGYFGGIESGASLDQLEKSARSIRTEAARLVRGAIVIQFSVLSFALLGAPHLIAALDLPSTATLSVQLGLVGASLQVLTLLGMLLLYYLDLRREACIVAISELVSIAIATSGACILGVPAAVGAAVGALVPALLALWTVRRVVSSLVPDTFQSQPYGELV